MGAGAFLAGAGEAGFLSTAAGDAAGFAGVAAFLLAGVTFLAAGAGVFFLAAAAGDFLVGVLLTGFAFLTGEAFLAGDGLPVAGVCAVRTSRYEIIKRRTEMEQTN